MRRSALNHALFGVLPVLLTVDVLYYCFHHGHIDAIDFHREFWGPPSIPWHDMIGQTGLYDSQNTGQIYTGTLVAVSLLGLALTRGVLWARDIRCFTVTASMALLYALAKYTPVFYLHY